MAREGLLLELAHLLPARVDHDLVVHGLAGHRGLRGVQSDGRDAVHFGLCDVLQRHGDVELPHQHLLIIGCGDELAPFVEEGHGIARLQVVVVLLADLTCPRVPLVDLSNS